jgi:hypothetical protein
VELLLDKGVKCPSRSARISKRCSLQSLLMGPRARRAFPRPAEFNKLLAENRNALPKNRAYIVVSALSLKLSLRN